MPTVAVAGGTGKLGRTIVEMLLENPGYNVVVLSRQVRVVSIYFKFIQGKETRS